MKLLLAFLHFIKNAEELERAHRVLDESGIPKHMGNSDPNLAERILMLRKYGDHFDSSAARQSEYDKACFEARAWLSKGWILLPPA